MGIGQSAVLARHPGHVDAEDRELAAFLRANADILIALAADTSCEVRQAAIPALGLFLDDAQRSLDLLQQRWAAAECRAERMQVARVTATLAGRLPAIAPAATAWLADLSTDPSPSAEVRLAALVHSARRGPEKDGAHRGPEEDGAHRGPEEDTAGLVPAALPLLRATTGAAEEITDILRTLHHRLGARIADRTTLLTAQLADPRAGARRDAVRMAGDLVGSWRGDHSALIRLVAAQLSADDPEPAIEAATMLGRYAVLAGPARDTLAALVAEQGPEAWSAPRADLRRLHQRSVSALAWTGDPRALPSLLAALDGDVDWQLAVPAAAHLRQASDRLLPRLAGRLPGASDPRGIVAALGELGDPGAVPVITGVLAAAIARGDDRTAVPAMIELRRFGPAAAPALVLIRSMLTHDDPWTRSVAVSALAAAGADRDEIMPLAVALLDTGGLVSAAGALGRIGPAAAETLPRLRELLGGYSDWERVHVARAVWDIGGEPEATIVLDTLLSVWESTPSMGDEVAECLKRMGPAARPALPRIRAELARPERVAHGTLVARDERMCRRLAEVLQVEFGVPADGSDRAERRHAI